MSRLPTITQLCKVYSNDTPHADHVTKLALTIFDSIRATFKIPITDRRFLEAAARLHDIGFCLVDKNHAHTGASIIWQKGISGFNRQQSIFVGAIVWLHQTHSPSERSKEFFLRRCKSLDNAVRLAAILKIADGLDHSHIQDCSIKSIKILPAKGNLQCVISVDSKWYQGNIAWAQKKSDLWQEAFPARLVISGTRHPGQRLRFAGAVHKADTARSAARQLLYTQYRLIMDNQAGASAGTDTVFLHDMRVALRRFRATLNVFKRHLPAEASQLITDIARIEKRLGPIRDHQVWLDFIVDVGKRLSLAKLTKWTTFRKQQSANNLAQLVALRNVLQSPEYKHLMLRVSRLLRCTLPNLDHQPDITPANNVLARRLQKVLTKVTSHDLLTNDTGTKDIHELRKIVRHARYRAEFAAPVLGQLIEDLSNRLTSLADALGSVHDIDLHHQRLLSAFKAPPRIVLDEVLRLRRGFWLDFRRSWRYLTDQKFLRKVNKHLSRLPRAYRRQS